mmetsp:Transcript_47409/g.152216  ORF Transcript_47409/g.152216 Transcript_47409/m.152216 type:complete len:229 (+) Transcript_47409:458-1144(+)
MKSTLRCVKLSNLELRACTCAVDASISCTRRSKAAIAPWLWAVSSEWAALARLSAAATFPFNSSIKRWRKVLSSACLVAASSATCCVSFKKVLDWFCMAAWMMELFLATSARIASMALLTSALRLSVSCRIWSNLPTNEARSASICGAIAAAASAATHSPWCRVSSMRTLSRSLVSERDLPNACSKVSSFTRVNWWPSLTASSLAVAAYRWHAVCNSANCFMVTNIGE